MWIGESINIMLVSVRVPGGIAHSNLIHTEAFPTREDARKREKYLKSAAGREFLSILKRVRNL